MTTFIDRFKLAVQVYRRGMPRSYKSSPITFPDFRVGQPQWHVTDLASYISEGFNANTLIHSAIMYKANALSSVPLRAYSGSMDAPDLLPETDPLAKLVARPNPSMSWREFQMLQEVWLNLSGNSFTYFDRPTRGAPPVAMYVLNPMRTYIVPDKNGVLRGYLYVRENQAMADGLPLLVEDVSHVKLPNPGDPLDGEGYGLSPLSPMAKSADVDNAITDFLKIFFDRGTMISGLLSFDMPMTDTQVDRARARWKEIYGGYTNWDETAILDQGGKYQRMGYTFDEMGFETLDERNESRILGPLGVPPQLLYARIGMKHSTYNNWDSAYNAFWNDTMLHEAKLFEDDFQYYLNDGNKFVAYDFSDVPAFQDDLPAIIDSFVKLFDRGVPRSMAAEITGLPLGELPDGEVQYMPLSLVPIEQAEAQRTANTEAQAPQPETEQETEQEPEEESVTEDVTEDERNEGEKSVKKKLPGHLHRKPPYGRRTTALVGVGSAASRMAQLQRLTGTSEKS